MKTIQTLIRPTRPHWVGDGFHVYPLFNDLAFTNELSPFLMLDYAAPKSFPPTTKKLGVGQHPHRGFETVTIAFQGEVEHGDSVGNKGVIGPGDVQWMTAASGIIHEEFHSRQFAKQGGTFEMIQLWVNLPAKFKMAPPRYQPILSGDIPRVQIGDGAGHVNVIAGEYQGIKGPAATFSPVNLWDAKLVQDKAMHLELPEGHRTILFVRSGSVQVGDSTDSSTTNVVSTAQASVLSDNGTVLALQNVGEGDCTFMILGGEPLGEPIANRGPFCMNTQEELHQAMVDYSSGKFGNHF
jgi:redox-sensitive bicupin YhaK (pirin superfamily)